ncbi:lysine--tRNA ligase [Ruficoccus amylovorans]|uniref:Lysine--tRNA ligase n=1 Tax=Ruficoccus amylovorans TaxID=1804625 RepID=A0A842HB31_9BACT|nr:lysine--tRNA ligase [Ruficoccus amylovorans]MBC2593339.1 lysine--tRNA ligase [Ruficoccus amylovorans]
MSEAQTDNTSDLIAVRRKKLADMRERGTDPFRANWDQTHTSKTALVAYEDFEKTLPPADSEDAHAPDGPEVSVAGRIVTFRLMGKASFVKILDRDGLIQLYVQRDALPEGLYNEEFKKLDLGDIIGVRGPLFRTKTGEVTVRVQDYKLVSKALRPLPEKFHGLTDSEQIYRQRYLDLITNQESRERFITRSRIIQEIRNYLWKKDFLEVETPSLHGVAGGAAARPFITHFNALDCDFYLRIALELHLKRLLVGGFDRVFELGRVFRNEGLSRRHNPEFTMLEVYQAYSDHRGMMDLIRGMLHHICENVLGTYQIKRADDDTMIDLSGNWREVEYATLVKEATGDADWFTRSREDKLAATRKFGIEVNPELADYEITQDVYEKMVEPKLIQPTFVTRIPKELIPLAKLNESGDGTLDIFELAINGQEIAPAYSEQNDPILQRAMLEAQVGEEKQNLDEDFLVALEHGMPPAGGMGVGIDRLIILLTGAANIRDTILFPALRPEKI